VAILTGIAVAPDGYWANGITSWPASPFTTANLFVKFDWEGQPLEVKVVEQVDKSYETWNTGLRLTHEADALVSAGVSFGWDEINQSGFAQFLLMNYDLTGDTVWTRNYTSFIYPNVWLRANGLLVVEDGYLLIGSAAEDPIPPDVSQMIVLRLDSAGEVLWQRAFHPDTERGEEGVSALRSANGGFVLGGRKDNAHRTRLHYDFRSYLLEVDTTGEILWEWQSPANELQFGVQDLVATPGGGWVVATMLGTLIPVNESVNYIYWDNYLYRLNAQRQLMWACPFRYTRTSFNKFARVLAAPDGSGYVGFGTQAIQYDPFAENPDDVGAIVAKASPQGDSLWSRIIIHPGLHTQQERHDIYDAAVTPDGGYILVGDSRSSAPEDAPFQQGWLLKLDEHGCLTPGCHLISSAEAELPPAPALALQLWPNPASEDLAVYLGPGDWDESRHIAIYNAEGREVLHAPARQADATYVLDVRALLGGMYFLQLRSARYGLVGGASFVKG
jgi:hypothetical protein